MINQIIKDWVGEDKEPMTLRDNPNEWYEENESETIGYNQAKAELRENTPQLTERIKEQLIEIIKENGHQQEDDTIWCDMDDIINTLKGGKE